MTIYKILESENLPESLKNKPRWVSCLIFSIGLLVVTLSAVSMGIFFGYTYCYLENRNAIRSGNLTQSANFHILSVPPYLNSEEARYNRSINGALSSILVSKMMKIGQAIVTDEDCSPYNNEESDISIII